MPLLPPTWRSNQPLLLRTYNFLELSAMGELDLFPTFAKAMMEELGELAWMASFVDSLSFDMFHIIEQASLHHYL
jgi:hypothetical protein